MMKNKQRQGFIIKIDNNSQILDIIFNSLEAEIDLKENFTKFVEEGSLKKYFKLLEDSREKKVIFGREINLNINNQDKSFLFIVLNTEADDKIVLAANQSDGIIKYYEELMRINNNFVNSLRKNIKKELKSNITDEKIYNEMSRLNNELVNLQRKLNKQNMLVKAEKEKYRVTLSNIAEGVISADSNNLIIYLNSQAEKMLGWSLEEANGKKCKEVFKLLFEKEDEFSTEIIAAENENQEKIELDLSELLAEKGEIIDQEAFLTAKNGEKINIEFSASYIKENKGKVIVFRDITERKDIENRLKKYASTDLLTEVLNRRAGLDYLSDEMKRAAQNKEELAIIFIDVNNLKKVNDNYGHQEGDNLLQKVSDILQKSLRRNDKVVRLGGDEFLLILPYSNKNSAEKIWGRIKDKFRQASKANKKDYKIAASHGVAEYTAEYQKSRDQLVNEADNIMYEEKKKSKGHR